MKFLFIKCNLLLLFFFTSVCSEAQESNVEIIADINMKSFGWSDDDWDSNTMREFLEKHMENRLKPTDKAKRYAAYEFYKAAEKKQPCKQENILFDAQTTWNDLSLFCGQNNKKNYVAEVLSRTQTGLGKVSLFLMLSTPINDSSTLLKRQAIVKTLEKDVDIFTTLDATLVTLEKPENVYLSFYKRDPLRNSVSNHCEYSLQGLDFLNKNETMLLIRSLYGHQQRIGWVVGNLVAACILTSYGVLNATNVIDMPDSLNRWAEDYKSSPGPMFPWLWMMNSRYMRSIVAITGGVLCGLSVKNNLGWAQDCFLIEECIYKVTTHLAQFINAARILHEQISSHSALASFEEFKGLMEFFNEKILISERLQEFLELISSDTFKQDYSIFSHKGSIVRLFTLMHEVKGDLESLAIGIGKVDAYLSLTKLYKEFASKNVTFCFPEYVCADQPQLSITNFWHPLINVNNVVTNSVDLGMNNNRPSMVITGPNAGGKSTVLKSIALCIVLAQTIGLVPARDMKFTPFNSIATYLNIVDDIGVGNSLFMAEAQQAQRLIDKVESSKPHEFSFTCFDEVFNGTSPLEGTAAAYSVACYLAKFKSNICCISTHFDMLTELEKETSTFSNYKVSVNHSSGDGISYPYKLECGSSNQHVALDILKAQGFAGSLLEQAQQIVEKMQQQKN